MTSLPVKDKRTILLALLPIGAFVLIVATASIYASFVGAKAGCPSHQVFSLKQKITTELHRDVADIEIIYDEKRQPHCEVAVVVFLPDEDWQIEKLPEQTLSEVVRIIQSWPVLSRPTRLKLSAVGQLLPAMPDLKRSAKLDSLLK